MVIGVEVNGSIGGRSNKLYASRGFCFGSHRLYRLKPNDGFERDGLQHRLLLSSQMLGRFMKPEYRSNHKGGS